MVSMIDCPNCGTRFSLNDVVFHELEEKCYQKVLQEFQQQAEANKLKLQAEITSRLQTQYQNEIGQIQNKNHALLEELSKMQTQAEDLSTRESQISQREIELKSQTQKQLEAAPIQIANEIRQQLEQDQALKLAEKDQIIETMKKTVDQLQRQAGQGSQQVQGVAGEVNLEKILQDACPGDRFERIKNSGDIIQSVISPGGNVCGTILWEAKNTASWQSAWVAKAQSDKRKRNANYVAVATKSLPKTISALGVVDKVWVSGFNSAGGLAILLHDVTYRVAESTYRMTVKSGRLDRLNKYLMSPAFTSQIDGIQSSHNRIAASIQQQINFMERQWLLVNAENKQAMDFVIAVNANIEAILSAQPIKVPIVKPPDNLSSLPLAN